MNKILPVMAAIILVLSGLGASAYSNTQSNGKKLLQKNLEKTTITPNQLSIHSHHNGDIELRMKDISTYTLTPGQPMLPKILHTVELPFGVQNVVVEVTPHQIEEILLTKQVRSAPIPLPLLPDSPTLIDADFKDKTVYQKNELYPINWFSYKIGCGLNKNHDHITHLAIDLYPVRYNPQTNTLNIANSLDVEISYKEPTHNPFPTTSEYDLVIITPSEFIDEAQRLVDHKNSYGIETLLKTTEEIYDEYTGFDKPEQIKYFIKDAIETYDITYVCLLGGMNSWFWAKPRDDYNQGVKGWHVPVRYNNLFDDPEHPLLSSSIYDPGVITDLYYADIYEDGGNFSSWDPNEDGVYAAWGRAGVENDTGIDMYPDVSLGRLACRNIREVKNMIDKIITYEESSADPSWFKKMIVVSGDGFLDQKDLDFQWDTNGLANGEYTIHAQSNNPADSFGLIDIVNVTIDSDAETNISFTHDDHLQGYSYPREPMTDITSPSEGDILGNSDFFYEPNEGEAYGNMFTGWANVSFESGIMHIRGKSYDPQAYGNLTDIHLWITNSEDEIIFSDWRNNTEMYYEGEWVTGDKSLKGRGGALYYMPNDFEKEILWTSNGALTGQDDVITSVSEGAGFVFFSGHGSPRVWGDHYPGVPGNRGYGSITGLSTMNFWRGPPFFPMDALKNDDKPFILVVGGCHNSQFNVSLVTSLLDRYLPLYMWTYGSPAPECWSWWMTRLKGRGAIASIGNTGLGYGTLGSDCNIGGLDGGISAEFFRQYGEQGHQILGDVYYNTLTYYVNTFDMQEDDHVKSLQQWVLLGDPSLMIGGYS